MSCVALARDQDPVLTCQLQHIRLLFTTGLQIKWKASALELNHISSRSSCPKDFMGFSMGKRKKVTFADLLGFSLVSVVEISPRNSLPNTCFSPKHKAVVKPITAQRRYLTCLFEQPVSKDDFLERVTRQYICLESVVCDKAILGFVRVLNIAYRKEVAVRYTGDGWKTFREELAEYLSTSTDGTMDTFFFRIAQPSILEETNNLEFAIRYSVKENVYWDNNFLKNYSVCLGDVKVKADSPALEKRGKGKGEGVREIGTTFVACPSVNEI